MVLVPVVAHLWEVLLKEEVVVVVLLGIEGTSLLLDSGHLVGVLMDLLSILDRQPEEILAGVSLEIPYTRPIQVPGALAKRVILPWVLVPDSYMAIRRRSADMSVMMYLMDAAAQMDGCMMKEALPLGARDCQKLDSWFQSLEQNQKITIPKMRIAGAQDLPASPATDQSHEDTLKLTTGVAAQVPFLIPVGEYQASEDRSLV